MTDSILCTHDGTVATVTINRPELRNAMDRDSWKRLGAIFEDLSQDTDLRCVVVAGAGGKAFGSGNDISEFETLRTDAQKVRAYNDITIAAVHAIEGCLHPTVARIGAFWRRPECARLRYPIVALIDLRSAGQEHGNLPRPALADTLVITIGRTAALELVLEGVSWTLQKHSSAD